MICYDHWSGRMFIADPDDIREKMANVQELLILKVHKPETIAEQYYRVFGSSGFEAKPWSWIFNS